MTTKRLRASRWLLALGMLLALGAPSLRAQQTPPSPDDRQLDDRAQQQQQQAAQRQEQQRPQQQDRQPAAADDRDAARGRQTDEDADETRYSGSEQAALGVTLAEGRQFGVRIVEVRPESPAIEAGLRSGDRIRSINGQPMSNYRDVIRAINRLQPDDEVQLVVERNGREEQMQLTLAKRDDVFDRSPQQAWQQQQQQRWQQQPGRPQPPQQAWQQQQGPLRHEMGYRGDQPMLGVALQRTPQGLLQIANVQRGSPAADAGLRERDEILAVDGKRITSQQQLSAYLRERSPRDQVRLAIWRDGRHRDVEAQLTTAGQLARMDERRDFDRPGQRQDQFRQDQARRTRDDDRRFEDQRFDDRRFDDQRQQEENGDQPALGVMLDNRSQRAVVADVFEDSPADDAGIRVGDQIVRLDGREIASWRDLIRQLNRYEPHQQVQVDIRRDGRDRSLRLTLAAQDDIAEFDDRGRQDEARDRRGFDDDRRFDRTGRDPRAEERQDGDGVL